MDVLRVNSEQSRLDAVRRGVEVLSSGGLIVIPTETVYGVAARADDPKAMARLREVKSRDGQKAFTVHIGSSSDAPQYVADMPAIAERLMRKVWPGPLTVVVPVDDPKKAPIMAKLNGAAADVLYFEGTVGLRCPDEPTASAILRSVSFPVVAASANHAGKEPPVSGDDAQREMTGLVDVLIDAGRTEFAKASTVVRVHGQQCEVLREGVYDTRTIKRLSALRILFVCTGNTCRSPMAEGIARHVMAERLHVRPSDLPDMGIHITSAGTSGGVGSAAEHAVQVMARRGIDLSDHSSSMLTADMIQQSDHVFAMTRGHREAILSMSPRFKDRVRLLLENEDVHDPIGGTLEEYEASARTIENGLRDRLREIRL